MTTQEKINKVLNLPNGEDILKEFAPSKLTFSQKATRVQSYSPIEQEVITAVKILLAE